MNKWFYQANNIIKGPINLQQLIHLIPTFQNPSQIFIWSRGQTDWISADRWQPRNESSEPPQPEPQEEKTAFTEETAIGRILATSINNTVTKVMTENTTLQKPTLSPEAVTAIVEDKKSAPKNEKYRVQLNFMDQPVMSKEELIAFAARTNDPSQIAIFDENSKIWKEVYSFKEIVDKLGLTRRKHPRVPILAQFNGLNSRNEKFSARLVTVSIGGFGLTDVYDLKIGDTISGQITSPHFYSAFAVEAEVTYSGTDGYVGLKFTQINDDSQSLVTDYVNRFSTQ